jgi:hypothetical protein
MPRPSGRRKPVDPYKSKIVKPPSQQRRDTTLRHAVTHKDKDAIEDYDEWDFRKDDDAA